MLMSRYHVLVVPSWYPTSEMPIRGTFFREQARALSKYGHRVGVIAPIDIRPGRWIAQRLSQQESISEEDDEGVPTFRAPVCGGGTPILREFRGNAWRQVGLELFERYVKRHGRPDIMHAHSALFGGVLAADFKREQGIPYAITEHSTAYARGKVRPWHDPLAKRAFSEADTRLVVSPELGKILERHVGSAVVPWEWLPNMVSDEFSVGDEPQKTHHDSFRVLNVGLLHKKKGQLSLLEAFAEAFRDEEAATLAIGGDGPIRRRLKAAANRLGIKKQVEFLGLLQRTEVRDQMRRADVFVLSSHYETFGLAAVEALACGTPVIATRCGGPECFIDESNGLLVPPRDSSALAKAMQQMRREIGDYERTSISATCHKQFGGEVLAARLTTIYGSILNGEAPSISENGLE
jgi:glycosyltransferase involved in cell wall biosynthesis